MMRCVVSYDGEALCELEMITQAQKNKTRANLLLSSPSPAVVCPFLADSRQSALRLQNVY